MFETRNSDKQCNVLEIEKLLDMVIERNFERESNIFQQILNKSY